MNMSLPDITFRLLRPEDAPAFLALRLHAIDDSPTSFSSSREDELGRSMAVHVQRIASPLQLGYGAFDGEGNLLGFAGLRREQISQLSHKATLWGVFVEPAWRGKSLARRLVAACIAHAQREPAILQLHLSVNTENNNARQLYESLGFKRYGTEPRSMRVGELYYDEHHLVLLIR